MIIKRFDACGDAEVADAKEPQPRYAWRRCRSPARQSRLGSRRGYAWRRDTASTRARIGRSGLAHCGGLRPRESRGRGRGCHAARGEEGRVPAAPSLVPARVRGLKVGGRARQGRARGRGGAGGAAAFGRARGGQRAPLPRCTWRGKRPGVGRSAACCGRAFSAPAGQEVPARVARGRPRRSRGLRPRAAGTAARRRRGEIRGGQEEDFVTDKNPPPF